MHAYLLSTRENSGTKIQISKLLKEHQARELPITLQKIEDVRNLKKLVNLTFNQKTAIIIENIDSASEEAQNAFLKNLEEPQKNIIYILTAANLHAVIPTIVSRCEVIKVSGEQGAVYGEDIEQFIESNLDNKLEYISKIKERDIALKFVENLIGYFHKQLTTAHGSRFAVHLQSCLETLSNLKSNGNVPLQLLNLVVKMNSQASN